MVGILDYCITQVQFLTKPNTDIDTFKRSQWGSGSDIMSAPLLNALGGFSTDQVLFLDDYEGNVIAAEALNIRSILVDGDGAKTVADLNAVLDLL